MKKILAFSILVLVLLPTIVLAATFRGDGNIPQSEVILGNVYLTGGSPVIAGTIQGDLYVMGGNVVVTGTVDEDAVIGAGNITVTGNVGGDLRVFGGSITIDGRVDGEVLASGGKVIIGPNAVIRKDLIVGGGDISVHPNAQIFGSSQIFADEKNERDDNDRPFMRFSRADFWVGQVFMILSVFLVAAIYMGLCPNVLGRIITEATRKGSFWKHLGLGFLILILTPIIGLICLITRIGALLGLIILLGYIGILILSAVCAGIILGGILKMKFARKKKSEFNWSWLILGIVSLHVLMMIPYVGGFIMFVMMLYAMGTIGFTKWKIAKAIK